SQALHFRLGFANKLLGICCAGCNVIGVILVRFFIKDSICHLNIRNEVDVIEKTICKEELRLLETNPEGDEVYHSRIAKKIFEDLVYLDRTELKLTDFLKRLWRNSVMLEIVLALFQSFSAGIHEYEFQRFTMVQFRGRYLIKIDNV
ncbi:hypothetical protein PENTCL1PPCAC_5580, partial [Pristionchus entomophagus]